MWHWGISVKTMSREVSVSALFASRRPLQCRGEAGEGKKKVRGRRPRALAILFDYGYPARAFADERGQCDNRDAEMIWNKRRTLFIQVRIDLEARLIITLLFKCDGEISWCYLSNETSSVKLLYSTTDFLQFTKQKFESYFHVNVLGHY